MKITNFLKTASGAPAYLYQHQFKKNNKTIYLQEMVHVAPTGFYEYVNKEIKSFLQNSKKGKVYLEGVIGTPEESIVLVKNLLNSLGVKINFSQNADFNKSINLKNFYSFLAEKLQWSSQKPENYLKEIPQEVLVHADVKMQDLIKTLETIKTPTNKNIALDEEGLEKIKNYIDIVFKFPLFKGFLKTILKTNIRYRDWAKLEKLETDNSKSKIFKLILDDRNQYLASVLINSKDENIFVTYGAAHFEGVKNILISNDYSYLATKKVLLEKKFSIK